MKRWFLFASLALSACAGSGASERCREACKRDALCHEERTDNEQEEEQTYKFDRDECEATCATLERDDTGRDLVGRHVQCLDSAKTCAEVRACP